MLLRLLPIAMACLACVSAARAQGAVPEAEVEAAVAFNLLAFVQWPAEALRPAADERRMLLCSLEGGAMEKALTAFEGKTVHGLPFAVRRIGANPEEARQCQAVFVPAGRPGVLSRLAAQAAQGQPLLIIGEGGGAVNGGAMVGLDVAGGRIVLDVDQAAIGRAGMTASSKLLRLARIVR